MATDTFGKRSPITPVSQSFYDDITRDVKVPSPVSREFYDSITKPVETARTPIPTRTAGDWVKDTAIDAAKSLVGTGEFAVGLADLPTGNLAGNALSKIGYDPSKTRQILESGYSQARQEANKNVANARGFVDTTVALAENPSAAFGSLVESSLGSLGIAGATRVVAGKMLAKAGIKAGTEAAAKFLSKPSTIAKLTAAGATAEGAQTTGSIQEQGRQGGREWSDTVLPAILGGVGTAAISFLSSKIVPDVEVKLALAGMAGKQEKNTLLTAGKEIAKSSFKEGVLEEMPQSAQEQVFTNLAMGKPWDEGVAEAAAQGMVVGALQGGGMATGAEILNRAKAEKDEDPYIKALSHAINIAAGLEEKINAGQATEKEQKDFNALTDAIVSQVTVLRSQPPEADAKAAPPPVPEGGKSARNPIEPAKESAARNVLLADEPEAKRANLTAKDILTEGDIDIQSEDDLTPENLAAIDKKLETAGTGGRRTPLNVAGEQPVNVVDITGQPGTEKPAPLAAEKDRETVPPGVPDVPPVTEPGQKQTGTFKDFVMSKGKEWPYRTTDEDYELLLKEFKAQQIAGAGEETDHNGDAHEVIGATGTAVQTEGRAPLSPSEPLPGSGEKIYDGDVDTGYVVGDRVSYQHRQGEEVETRTGVITGVSRFAPGRMEITPDKQPTGGAGVTIALPPDALEKMSDHIPDAGEKIAAGQEDVQADRPSGETVTAPSGEAGPVEIKAAGTGGRRTPLTPSGGKTPDHIPDIKGKADEGAEEKTPVPTPSRTGRITPALGTPEREQISTEYYNETVKQFQELSAQLEKEEKAYSKLSPTSKAREKKLVAIQDMKRTLKGLSEEAGKSRTTQRLAAMEDAIDNPRDEIQRIAASLEKNVITQEHDAAWRTTEYEKMKLLVEAEAKATGIPDEDLGKVVAELTANIANYPLTDTYEPKKYLQQRKDDIDARKQAAADAEEKKKAEEATRQEEKTRAEKETEKRDAEVKAAQELLSSKPAPYWETQDGVADAARDIEEISDLLGRELSEDEKAVVARRGNKNVVINTLAGADFNDLVRNSPSFSKKIRDDAAENLLRQVGIIRSEPAKVAKIKQVTDKMGLRKVVLSFASTDEKRANLTGFYNDNGDLVATNGNLMIIALDAEKDLASGKIYVPLKGGGLKDLGDTPFPEYKRVLPTRDASKDVIIPRSQIEYLVSLLNNTSSRNRLYHGATSGLSNFRVVLPNGDVMNGFYLSQMLEAAAKLGADDIALSLPEESNKPILFDAQKGEDIIAHIVGMPLRSDREDYGGPILKLSESDLSGSLPAPQAEEDAYTAAAGVISGGTAERIKGSKYEFIKGETAKGSDTYYKMCGLFSGSQADRLVAAGITIKKKADETAAEADILGEIAEISDDELDAMLDMPEKKNTPPKTTNEAIKNIFAAARDKQKGKLPSAQPKALDDILSAVAKEGVTGTEEALKGLYELFGGSSLKSFPGGFDEDTYAKAKPHFEAALEHFIQVGKGLREFAATIVQQFGDAIRPYLKQFIREKRDGVERKQSDEDGKPPINLDENTGKGEAGERKTRRKLSDQEKAERDKKKAETEAEKARKDALGKFENIGYVYDPEKINAKLKDKPPKSGAKILLDEMQPGKVFRIEFPDNASPGAVRLLSQTQKMIRTFKEFLFADADRLKYQGHGSDSAEKRIDAWVSKDDGTVDQLKEWAQSYGNAVQPIVDAFKGQSSITNIIGKLQEALGIAPNEEGAFADFSDLSPDNITRELAKLKIVVPARDFYDFVTNRWQTMLADENDILLSEINIHRRQGNKEISRTGLPDYRSGVLITDTEEFSTFFRFKGVGFGEQGWINQEERSRVVNAAYDAFRDLAATIGAPANGMSLGGNMAVQFANLGHKAKGGAAAFFPSIETINFTRDNGDGTMAHEWGHGIHHMAANDAMEEINAVINSFFNVYDFDAGKRYVDDLLAKDSTFLKRMVSNKRQVRIDAVKDDVRDNFTSIVKKETDYCKTARLIDPDYTAQRTEMWARAFEAYIYDTMPGRNNYLVSDSVAAGRVGGKASVGTRMVYPAGVERETFNEAIGRLMEGLKWEDGSRPTLKEDYVKIELHDEQLLQEKLNELLATVEERYKAIWASEPSADGFYWYRYDETSFGPMMQPDWYGAYDKEYTAEGQIGTGAVGYLTQLHPDDILDYKLSNIQYDGKNPVYPGEGGDNFGNLQADGETALDEVSAGDDGGTEETGDIRSGDRGSGDAGESGTREYGKPRGTSPGSEGDSPEGIHPSPAGNYRITDPALNDPRNVNVRFTENLGAIRVLKQIEAEDRPATTGGVSFGTEPPPGGWSDTDKVPADQRKFPSLVTGIGEKEILSRYSGWGGMAELFSWDPNKAWVGKADIIKAELTEDEIAGAESSSPSAYYTPVPVGQFMWKLAQRLGFKGGIVLDPSLGANGLFFGAMPSDLEQSTTLQGIEMDALSARIASRLYELATIEHKPFQAVKKPNNRYDLTITNVPFENVVPSDTKHNKGQHKLHNYFINKMLDLTAPGALNMVITSSRTFDHVGSHLTEYAAKADLVGAIRLPSGIFSATDVVTDILVFRKKIEGSKFEGIPVSEWTTAGTDTSTGLTINNYFINHPDMIAGKLEKVAGRYGDDVIRVVGEGDITQALERIAPAFPGEIVEREATREIKSIDDLIAAPGTVKEGGFYINDKNEVCLKANGEEEKLPLGTASEKRNADVAREFIQILDQVRATIRIQKTTTDAGSIKAEQANLRKVYDAFVKKFGPVNDPKNYAVYSDATDYAWVTALEEYDPDAQKVTSLADIFTKNIAGESPRPERAETDLDALAYSLDEFGYPNLEYMARLRGSDVATVLAGVQDRVVENPETGFIETTDEYLSGNVKQKLKIAREIAASSPEYARNVKLLEAALPPDVPASRITARIGASWILPEHLSAFVDDKMNLRGGLSAVYNFNRVTNEWTQSFSGGWRDSKAGIQRKINDAKNSVEATRTWGTLRRNFFELMEDALTGKRPVVSYYDPRAKKDFMDVVATKAAEDKLQDIQTEFGQWLFRSPVIGDDAVKRFNDIVNTSVPMKADGAHLTFPGKSLWMLTQAEEKGIGVGKAPVFYPHQVNAVWMYLKNGNIYLAHEVGAGKTVTMALIAMEAKRLRGKRKVLYVTLNDSTMGQAVAEIKALYPLANILPVRVSTNEQRKQRALQKMALNDFDIAIMRQQDLDRIALSPEAERVFIEEELAEYREVLEEARANGARIQEQAIQQAIHALEERLKAPGVHDEAKQKNLFFDDIGVDLMIVDEAHKYKNVSYATRLTRITGLNPAGSPTAQAFFRKTQYLNATYPKHDAIVLATGSALSNSIAEMYNIQRIMQPQEVKRQGTWSFDRWIANFGDIGTQLEWDATANGGNGAYKTITTVRRIVNAGRMLATAFQNVDSVRADDTPIRRPKIRGGSPQNVTITPNQYVADYKLIVAARANALIDDPRHAVYEAVPDNILRIISNMSKVAIDQRLDHHYENTELQQDSKIYDAANRIYRRWQEEKEHRGVQLVFSDLGTPKRFDKFKYKTDEQVAKLDEEELSDYNEAKYEHENAAGGFNVYDALKQELIKRGIPREQIAFIHDADHSNKDKKAANLRSLFKRVNNGDVRVLIGSTSKAGTGINVQKRVSDVHHLDIWWNYSAWEQRNGRGRRAGNIYTDLEGIYIWNYVTETTVDATRWDKVFAKGKVMNAVLGGDINIDVIEDYSDDTVSARQTAAEASGDPLTIVHATVLKDVQTLRFAQAAYLDNVRTAKIELAAIPDRIAVAKKNILDYTKSHDLMQKVTAVRFIGDDNTYVFEKHGKEIIAALEKAIAADPVTWTADKKKALLVFGFLYGKGSHGDRGGEGKEGQEIHLCPAPRQCIDNRADC